MSFRKIRSIDLELEYIIVEKCVMMVFNHCYQFGTNHFLSSGTAYQLVPVKQSATLITIHT